MGTVYTIMQAAIDMKDNTLMVRDKVMVLISLKIPVNNTENMLIIKRMVIKFIAVHLQSKDISSFKINPTTVFILKNLIAQKQKNFTCLKMAS